MAQGVGKFDSNENKNASTNGYCVYSEKYTGHLPQASIFRAKH